MSDTVKLPNLGSFLIDRYLDARYANPEDKLNNIPSTHLAARIIYHIASHAKQYVKLSRHELAEMFSVTDSPIKKALGGLKSAELITTENNYSTNTTTNRVERSANTIMLNAPRKDWYLSDELAVNASAAMALFRARKYVLKALRNDYKNLVFGDSFLVTGAVKFAKLEDAEDFVRVDNELVRVEIGLRMGRNRSSLGSKSTQQIRLTKEIYKELIKNKNLIAFPEIGNTENIEFKLGDQSLPETENQKEPESNETNQLTEEVEAVRIDPVMSEEDQEMPKYEKVNPSKQKATSTDELIARMQSNGGSTKKSYNQAKHGDPLKPTSKAALKHTVRALNTKATNGTAPAPHYSQIACVESLAKMIAANRGRKQADYIEAVKAYAFVMQNYAAYMTHLNPSLKTISPNVNLSKIYASRHYEDVLAFCNKHAAKYQAFDVTKWGSNSNSPAHGGAFDEKTNPTTAQPPKRAQDAAQSANLSGGNFGDLAKEIFGEG
ncbi:hypothetical protein [Vibrio phage vB_VhaS-a]|nr:hypothetical protein [Vibrio phage vB_VhaS-a]